MEEQKRTEQSSDRPIVSLAVSATVRVPPVSIRITGMSTRTRTTSALMMSGGRTVR